MRKLQNQHIRKLVKAGKQSISVTLPIEMVRELGWREGQKVTVKRVSRGMLIRDWRRR